MVDLSPLDIQEYPVDYKLTLSGVEENVYCGLILTRTASNPYEEWQEWMENFDDLENEDAGVLFPSSFRPDLLTQELHYESGFEAPFEIGAVLQLDNLHNIIGVLWSRNPSVRPPWE